MIDETFPFVGEFRELGHGRPDGPSLRSTVRAQEPESARELVEYLRAGTVLAAATTLVHDVLSPNNAVIGELHLLTDGRWLWYSDLAQYVERHHVALDPLASGALSGPTWQSAVAPAVMGGERFQRVLAPPGLLGWEH
ncbi:hypothetical protein [Streptomyces sp. NBC_00467]|uniref:hypothetical protein n=1 Tax=Streptomyces sp. NBC_00467 TaxID=2975752 RepID=UPI002E170AE9